MIDRPQAPPAPVGVIYDTSMARPDAALALAALYVAASRRVCRVNGVCVNGSGLGAAIFCDVVGRFYTGTSRPPSSNTVLPVGFAAAFPAAPDPPMVARAIGRTGADGQPQYVRSITRVSDTAAADALLRNAVTLSVEAVVVLSAPATSLAKAVALAGAAGQYKERVKRVVIVDAGGTASDPEALKALVAELPVPVVYCGRDVGDALRVPRSRVETSLTWSAANPVADAIAAAGEEEFSLDDLAGLYYALNPDSPFFAVTGGRLSIVAPRKTECVAELLGLATAKPAAPARRGGGI